MTPRERFLGALRGDRIDRVPLDLHSFTHPTNKGLRDPGMQEILDRIGEELAFLHTVPSEVNRYLVTPPQFMREVKREVRDGAVITTTEIDTPKGVLTAVTGTNEISSTVWTLKYPVESREDIEKIRSVPWELPAGVAPPDVSSLPDAFPRRGIMHTGASSPFVCVAGMMPYQMFLEMCATELGLLKELTEQCYERIRDVLEVIFSTRRIEFVWMGGCEWVTPPMAAHQVYEELVQPFEAKLIAQMHAAGALSHVHCHGNVRSTLELAIARGADLFEPVEPPPDGDITFAEAKALAAGRITLGGNIEARILENETLEDVEEASRAAFEGGKYRMIFQTTAGPLCDLTPRMIANYHRMIDVWEELSPME